MTDIPDDCKTLSASEPLTATDVQIAELNKRLVDMQAKYDAIIADYQTENRRLYAHAVGDAPTEDIEEPTFSIDKASQAFYKSMGIQLLNGN